MLKAEEGVKALQVSFAKDKFAHLTGIRPVGRGLSAEKLLDDFAEGRGHYPNLTLSNGFDDFGTYNATVTNNLGFTIKGISIVAKLKDASGTVLEGRYLNASNWKDGEAHKFDFGTSEQFTTIEYSVEYVEYGDA